LLALPSGFAPELQIRRPESEAPPGKRGKPGEASSSVATTRVVVLPAASATAHSIGMGSTGGLISTIISTDASSYRMAKSFFM
jgi:hypothetical protein